MNIQDNLEIITTGLEKALGVKLKIKDIIQEEYLKEDKEEFIKMINYLEKIIKMEQKLLKQFKMDTSSTVEPYWGAIERILYFSFGEDAATVILWYLFDRDLANPTVATFQDDDGTEYVFKGASDLYEFLSYRFNF